MQFRSTCGKCGATRIDSQIGLEPSPDAYVAELVAVFRAVRRVLRDDGVLFLNLGDSYASHDPGGYRPGEFLNPDGRPPVKQGNARNRAGNYRSGDLKPKDLMMIPARVALALQGRWLVAALRHHLGQAEPDARKRHRPAHVRARACVSADKIGAVFLGRGICSPTSVRRELRAARAGCCKPDWQHAGERRCKDQRDNEGSSLRGEQGTGRSRVRSP